uniref:DNA 3'-5' helicase n=1 Tax=Amphimedon queenslandica TaxID=400682 RepID=A0A1X7UPI7_AMPQE
MQTNSHRNEIAPATCSMNCLLISHNMTKIAKSSRKRKRRFQEDTEKKRHHLDSIIRCCAHSCGYEDLKKEQKNAITTFVEGNDVFVCLPTGFGKSVCYFCLPLIFDALNSKTSLSVAPVVSPLVALMNDQVQSLTDRGITAIMCSGISECELSRSLIREGMYWIVFVIPEILFDRSWTTSTMARWKEVMRILGMRNAALVTKSPDKPNIYYKFE